MQKYCIPRKAADTFEELMPQLSKTLDEMKELSKKKPDSPVNKFKINLINRILKPVKALLEGEPPAHFLDVFSIDDVPTNSDVVLVMTQYAAAMTTFRKRHSDDFHRWNLEEGEETDDEDDYEEEDDDDELDDGEDEDEDEDLEEEEEGNFEEDQ